ncbi:flagellar basal-body rod protein FlgF [Xanthobacter agilis]|uniref:Flagellar basal-body rod protein FlgF n=1 Tax=Xanthobacter agilis TaxID=47492 RepID=A0ABU0LHT2_XANAG|nr:flagellar basal-body rod protein FlgF [Xanthobacter agilis]MDQ0506678.1 flagellar basal-body rod protein FlgF [Xanthobacter agilis]
MSSNLYVALSAQMAADKRLTTVANNIANMNTPGFRAEQVRFSELLSETAGDKTSYVSEGETFTALRPGPITQTGNPLDLAVEGEGWFAVRTDKGVGYTRDGRMQMTTEGALQNMSGLPMLDAGGAPLMVDPNGGALRVGTDGSLYQQGRVVGRVGVYTMGTGSTLTRYNGSTMMTDQPPALVQEFTRNKVLQGYSEGSNVDPVMEMTRLISLQRAFEQAANAVSQNEDMTTSAIRQLGPSS